MTERRTTWRNVAWSVGSGWSTLSPTPNLSCKETVVDFLYVHACHQSRCTCSASRFYCHRRNTCTMGWWHRTCGPTHKMCSFAVPLHSSHRWVHAPQHGYPDRDARKHFNFILNLNMACLDAVGTNEGTSPRQSNLVGALHLQPDISATQVNMTWDILIYSSHMPFVAKVLDSFIYIYIIYIYIYIHIYIYICVCVCVCALYKAFWLLTGTPP